MKYFSGRIVPLTYFIHLPMEMEPIVSSETSAIRTQTPGNYPKRNNLHLEHGESLRTRKVFMCVTHTACVEVLERWPFCNNVFISNYINFVQDGIVIDETLRNTRWLAILHSFLIEHYCHLQ